MEITDLLQQMKKADERTEFLKFETQKRKIEKPGNSKLTNKQKYLRSLRGFRK